MSHPVFLNAVSQPRMPDGSRNEWRDFWHDGAVELEGNGWPPLLWLALFRPGDLRHARMADTEDAGSEGRAELEEAYGEATYPYLVASIASASAALASRRQVIIEGIGAQFAPTLDAFAAWLEQKFPAYVLCRTSGLADAPDAGPEMERALADFERLAPQRGGADAHAGANLGTNPDTEAGAADNGIAREMAALRRQNAAAQMFMLVGAEFGTKFGTASGAESGTGGGTGFGTDAASAMTDSAMAPQHPAPAAAPPRAPAPRNSEWLGWGSAIVVGFCAVAVYLRTHSVGLGVLAFAGACAVVVFLRVKLLR